MINIYILHLFTFNFSSQLSDHYCTASSLIWWEIMDDYAFECANVSRILMDWLGLHQSGTMRVLCRNQMLQILLT